jgi:hypothetical protein
MDVRVGDEMVVDSGHVGGPTRKGVVLQILGEGDTEHYLVRWDDNGHETIFFPGPDAHVVQLRSKG